MKGQSVEVRLNGTTVERLAMNDVRQRYRIGLPAQAQRPGDNRLRFVFAAAASPSDADPASLDRRPLAAAFYTLVTGPASDPSLDDLLARDAPRPFALSEEKPGVPALTLLGPAIVRFALALPPSAELRFTPELERMARSSAGAASFRVLVETADAGERELWSRVLDARAKPVGEQVVRIAGRPGEIVRIGLAVGEAGAAALRLGPLRRAARARPRRRRSAGAGAAHARPRTRAPTRCARALARSNVLLDHPRRGSRAGARLLRLRASDDTGDRPHRRGGRRLRAGLHAGRVHARGDVVALDLAVSRTATTARSRSTPCCRRTG